MPDYDFRALSPIDFETLVRDLLQKELKLTLENFKSGADQGIDLRYISVRGNQMVVQCKHYVDSTFRTLLRDLKNKELEKVKQLKPKRYIFATSVPLNRARKDEIRGLFQPFIKKPSDIYGREGLNNLLGRFPEIEKQTFKLWFSSTAILEEMLRTRINNLSRETLARIQRNAKVYVENGSFGQALSILERLNFCLIVGIPGIGKTMLAEMLLLHYYSDGYDIVKIESDISEAREVDYVNKRRVFYYDDFLGQTSESDKLFNKNEDSSLLEFIAAINRSRVSKLILTTREYILNKARLVYEKIDRTRFESQTCIVDLSKYTRMNRAKILYNHVYFSDLPAEHKATLLENKSYLRIIGHSNYSPRIIENMTDYSRLTGVTGTGYVDHFLSNLDNPEDLWRHPFSHLAQPSQDLLIVLLSLPNEVFLEDLEEAFQSYRKECFRALGAKLNQADFKNALRVLDGDFVATNQSREKLLVRFQNPSVRDFLQNYLVSNREELRLLVRSVVCFEQLHWLWEHQDKNGSHPFRSKIAESLSVDYLRRLHSVFVIPSFRLVNYVESASSTHSTSRYKEKLQVSFEDRALLVASVISEISGPSIAAIWKQSLDYLTERVDAGAVVKEDLVLLLKTIDTAKLVTFAQREHLLSRTKELLLSNIAWLDEYRPLLLFTESFPDVLSSEEKSASAKAFPPLARRNILDELDEDDPDSLRSYASEIEDIAKALGVDVTELLSDIESRARNREENAEQPDELPEHGDDHQPQPFREWCSDDEIESIFNVLQ